MSESIDQANSFGYSLGLAKFAVELSQLLPGCALDVPCGGGRNAFFLSRIGFHITGVDIEGKRLNECVEWFEQNSTKNFNPVLADVTKENWLIGAETHQIAINIHFVHIPLIDMLMQSLVHGGLIYIETPENRGSNYLQLPSRGEYSDILQPLADLVFYKERPAGPPDSGKVTMTCLARKR